MDSYWGFLVGQITAKVPIGPEGSWEWSGAPRFVAKQMVQIDRQRERTVWDKLNSVRIKLIIAMLIQRYNIAIVSS
jgi:hypothetical protein